MMQYTQDDANVVAHACQKSSGCHARWPDNWQLTCVDCVRQAMNMAFEAGFELGRESAQS